MRSISGTVIKILTRGVGGSSSLPCPARRQLIGYSDWVVSKEEEEEEEEGKEEEEGNVV